MLPWAPTKGGISNKCASTNKKDPGRSLNGEPGSSPNYQ